MAMPGSSLGMASVDLGLGSTLNQQVQDETEEEKRRRKLGLSALQSPASSLLIGGAFGRAGVGQV